MALDEPPISLERKFGCLALQIRYRDIAPGEQISVAPPSPNFTDRLPSFLKSAADISDGNRIDTRRAR